MKHADVKRLEGPRRIRRKEQQHDAIAAAELRDLHGQTVAELIESNDDNAAVFAVGAVQVANQVAQAE